MPIDWRVLYYETLADDCPIRDFIDSRKQREQAKAGATLTSIVISLPTIGPLLLRALQAQDMYLAGSMVMLLSGLGIIGTLISDMLLLVLDPRSRFETQAEAG